jgi:hypothetical protein
VDLVRLEGLGKVDKFNYLWSRTRDLRGGSIVPQPKHPHGTPRPVTGTSLFLYVDDVRTSQETRPCAVEARYGDRFDLLYVDDACTSQETRPCAVEASYGDRFDL